MEKKITTLQKLHEFAAIHKVFSYDLNLDARKDWKI
jgi:hypothetical protein